MFAVSPEENKMQKFAELKYLDSARDFRKAIYDPSFDSQIVYGGPTLCQDLQIQSRIRHDPCLQGAYSLINGSK